MLGLTKREIQRRFDEIVEFAELKDFIDAPVKTYSSGMYMRLGFAVAIHVDPDVLLVDEVLAVGDEAFTAKCLDKFAEFRRRNKTILLVTHSLDLVERFCDEALWLDKGKTHGRGRSEARRRRVPDRRREAEESGSWRKTKAPQRPCDAASRAAAPRSGDQPSDVVDARRPNMFQADRGPLGIARGRDHRRDAASAPTATPATCFSPASRWRSA